MGPINIPSGVGEQFGMSVKKNLCTVAAVHPTQESVLILQH